ncbi:MAG: hypothetical protein JJT89_04745 [Nitriliruptoraceae bacterium]|nr:hypothetical protein [Nitriliruptoraceae bacterium]
MIAARRQRLTTIIAATALALAACSADEPDADPTDDTATPEEDVEDEEPEATDEDPDEGADDEAPAADEDADGDADDDGDAEDDGQDAPSADAAEPFGSSETGWGGPGGGDVRLDLMEVTRRGEDFMEVRFRLTNLRDERSINPFSRLSDGEESGPAAYNASGLTVEDVDAGERLLVLRDSAGNCVCSTDLGESITVGSSRDYFARFPAPVSGRVDVAIPTFSTFNDVPVG